MDNILSQLYEIKNELNNPFPYRDTDKIQDDFQAEFLNLSDEEDCLVGDFNTYCMNIAGTLSYVLSGKTNKIPKSQIEMLKKSFFDFKKLILFIEIKERLLQIEMLKKSFFDFYKQYKFFEDKIETYNDFYKEYKTFEQTRRLLLQLVSK